MRLSGRDYLFELNDKSIWKNIETIRKKDIPTPGDKVILETIFGDNNPSGKLPFEIPSSMEEVESQNPDVADDTNNPIFKYGHGLSYPE